MVVKSQLSLIGFYHKKHILITGASGYIAWNLIKKLGECNCTISCFSRNAEKIEKQKVKANIKVIAGSYNDENKLSKVVKGVDIIFHLASQTSLYKAEKNPLEDYVANVLPMQLLLEACRKEKTCPILVFPGTSTQCGMPETLPVDENVIDVPITTYDFHKLQAEHLLKFYTRQGWVEGVSLRLTNVYGPGPKSSSADRGILNQMINKALNEDKLTVYGKGKYIRDYIYIDDVVFAFLNAPIHINNLKGKHFVLGSGEGTTIRDAFTLVGEIVNQKTGLKVAIEYIDFPNGMAKIEFRNFTAEISSLLKIGLCNEMHNLFSGISNTIEYFHKGPMSS